MRERRARVRGRRDRPPPALATVRGAVAVGAIAVGAIGAIAVGAVLVEVGIGVGELTCDDRAIVPTHVLPRERRALRDTNHRSA